MSPPRSHDNPSSSSAPSESTVVPCDASQSALVAQEQTSDAVSLVDNTASTLAVVFHILELATQIMQYRPDTKHLPEEFSGTVEHWGKLQLSAVDAVSFSKSVERWLFKVGTGLGSLVRQLNDLSQSRERLDAAKSRDDEAAFSLASTALKRHIESFRQTHDELSKLCDDQVDGDSEALSNLININREAIEKMMTPALLGPGVANLKQQFDNLHELQQRVSELRNQLFALHTDLHDGPVAQLREAEAKTHVLEAQKARLDVRKTLWTNRLAQIDHQIELANADSKAEQDRLLAKQKALEAEAAKRYEIACQQRDKRVAELQNHQDAARASYNARESALLKELESIK